MTKSASTPRVCAYRERRRLGVRCMKVAVSKTVIEALVRMTYSPEDLQQDVSAIQKAVQTYVACPIPSVTALRGRSCCLQRGFIVAEVDPVPAARTTSSEGSRTPLFESGRSAKWFNATCQANDGIYLFAVIRRSAVVVPLSVLASRSGLVISWKDVLRGFGRFFEDTRIWETPFRTKKTFHGCRLLRFVVVTGRGLQRRRGRVQAPNFWLRRGRGRSRDYQPR